MISDGHDHKGQLSPSALEINKRYFINAHMTELADGQRSGQRLLDYAISEAAVWACTACGACVQICPVGNEPMFDILYMRRNQVLMDSMEREVRAHRALQDILINPRWRPRNQFNAVQSTIQSTLGEIFQSLTRAAVQKRDTQAEYDAIQKRINENCGGK